MAKYSTIQQHEPLRTPDGWSTSERRLIAQLEEIFDDIYRRFGRLSLDDMSNSFRLEFSSKVSESDVASAIDGIDEFHNTAVDIDATGVAINTTGSIKAIVDDTEQMTIDEDGMSARRLVARESLTAPDVVNKHLSAEIPWRGGIQQSLDAIANHLTVDAALHVPAGTYLEDVSIKGFVGAALTVLLSPGVVIEGAVEIKDCNRVTIKADALGDASIHPRTSKDTVTVIGTEFSMLENLYISGYRWRSLADNGSECAVRVNGGNCNIVNCGLEYSQYGAYYENGASGFVFNAIGGTSGDAAYKNTNILYGLYAANGAHVAASGTVPMGGTSATGQTLATLLSGTVTPTAGGMEYVPPSEVTKTFALTSQCTYRQNKTIGSDLRQGLYGEYTTKGWGIASMWFAEATNALKGREIIRATLTLRRAVGGSSAPVNAYFGTVPLTAENYDSTAWPAFTKCDSLYPGEKIAREGEMTYDVTELMPAVQQGHALALHEPIKSYTDDYSPAYAIFYGLNSGHAPVLTVTYVPDASEPPVPDEPESVTVQATAAYSRSAGGLTNAETLGVKAQDTDNIVLTFPANDAFLTCEKLTLHINSKTASRTLKTIALRKGSTASSSMSVSAGIATPVPAYGITETGWQAIDVTAGFTDAGSGVTRELAAAEGIKIWLRTSSGTCTIYGINSEECPYLTAE